MRRHFLDFLWFLVVLTASSGAIVDAGSRLGATFDEPFYLKHGLEYHRTGIRGPLLRAGTMPLPIQVQTWPIAVWERGRGVPFSTELESERLIPVARLGTLLFWFFLLLYSFRWGHLLGGSWGGRLAVAFVACDPSLISHAALATTDVPITATILLATYHWFVGRDQRYPRRVIVPGVLYGVALATKASAFAFIPILFLVLGLVKLQESGSLWMEGYAPFALWRQTRGLVLDLTLSLFLGFTLTLIYCGTDGERDQSFVAWAATLPDGTLKEVMTVASERLAIFSNGAEAIVQQIKHNIRGHGSYVLGEWHDRAVWYYFPVVIAAKMTPFEWLIVVAALIVNRRSFRKPLGWCCLALVLFSFNCRVQIGIRLQFPLVALMIVHGAAILGESVKGRWIALVSLVGAIGMMAANHPHGMQYANPLFGGERNARYLFGDSNFDWGQGLPELKTWAEEHPDRPLAVWFYGADPAVRREPFHLLEVHYLPGDRSLERVKAIVGPGYFAVSVSLLDCCPIRDPQLLETINRLKQLTPVATTRTFVIYTFSER